MRSERFKCEFWKLVTSNNENHVSRLVVSLLYIRRVPGSDLGSDTGYPDRFFMAYLIPAGHVRIIPRLGHDCFIPHSN
jgi:hypothetical protein